MVEDEALIRMMLAEMVEELGHRVVVEAGNVKDGQALAGSAVFDLALLEINLDGSSISPVAEIIARRDLPFSRNTPQVNTFGDHHHQHGFGGEGHENYTIVRFDDGHSLTVSESAGALAG